jgi:hypothetical protein
MRLPYHLFLKYLLLTKHSDQEVRDLLRQVIDEDVGTAYLNRIRQDELLKSNDSELRAFLTAPQDSVVVKLHRSDLKPMWAEAMDVSECHESSTDFQVAYKCFSDHRKRNYLSVYSLCIDISAEKLIELFTKRFGEPITEEQLFVFVKYFADFESMTALDWEKFVSKLTPRQRALYVSAPGRRIPYIQWKMGDSIDLDPDKVNHALMSDFYFLARDEYSSDFKRDGWADRSAKFAGIALSAGDRVKKTDRPRSTTKQLIMLFREQEGEIASYESVNTGDDQQEINPGDGDPEGDS